MEETSSPTWRLPGERLCHCNISLSTVLKCIQWQKKSLPATVRCTLFSEFPPSWRKGRADFRDDFPPAEANTWLTIQRLIRGGGTFRL